MLDPDRVAPTLAVRARMLAEGTHEAGMNDDEVAVSDARVDLRLARHAAERALERRGTEAARERLRGLDTPQLRAGTVQDGTARGLLVAYEEAISLCSVDAMDGDDEGEAPTISLDDVVRGHARRSPKELRRLRDVAVVSGGSRVRWTRREGLMLIDRAAGVQAASFLTFEDRIDGGDLDAFASVEDDQPRVFWPQSLQPHSFVESEDGSEFVLAGRLGSGPRRFPCRIRIIGRKTEQHVAIEIALTNAHDDHRLRVRFHGLPDASFVASDGSPAMVATLVGGRTVHAVTLVRACGRLRVGDPLQTVAVPGANCRGTLVHRFRVGSEVGSGIGSNARAPRSKASGSTSR